MSGVGKVKDVVIVGAAKGDASVVGVVARVVIGVVGVVRVVVSDRVWWDHLLAMVSESVLSSANVVYTVLC